MAKRSTKSARVPGPYRGEHGAIHHEETGAGFLFTVSPPAFAGDVADALNVQTRLKSELEAAKLPTQRFDAVTFQAREWGVKSWAIWRTGPGADPAPVLFTGEGAGNPDVFASHVAGCLNLNAAYTAALLPVVRLMVDAHDGKTNRTAEQTRAYWRELRRIVDHYDAVTGLERSE